MKRLGWTLYFLLVAYFIFLIRQDIIDNLELRKEKLRVEEKVAAEGKFALDLKGRLNRLKGDDLIEELARTRLGLIKKGETAYKVIMTNEQMTNYK
ncbi:septum formation initiator family protein [Candidatus Saganbacteria bacterium]|uniref:Septum formation initiator family protein n=1 Tax=Candidatus Saganbacteria bacterium TaxID=2575572 RepID=A0A9D6UN54_UNCSA|nr:septum formation initiator family protein [Candidatus Saganbacteria bacterium]